MFFEPALTTSRTFLDPKLCGQLPGSHPETDEEPTGEEEEDEEGRWGFLELPIELFVLTTWLPLLDDSNLWMLEDSF